MTREHASITKITRPSAKGIFPRKRLFQILDTCRKYPVTWVSGPAGSGKTTLVASYLDANKLPCLWYQVDEGDSDIATFFYYMGMAGRKAAPRKKKPLPLLTPEYLQGISTFTLRYFENLFGRLKVPSILVLDNYHSVPADSSFHNMLSDGLSTIPDGMNVIIISRHDLPPALSRLHANGLIGMLGWDELRLTLEETAGIVPLKAKPVRSRDTVRQLHLATDGWVAGLVLMLESIKRGVEPHVLGKLTQREVVDYFGNEFFNRADKGMQDFLLQTAFLPRMTAKMAEKLTGLPDADKILSTLNRNNYFTERNYSVEPLYQYHALFREFLMARAKETLSHETLSTLLHRAALLLDQGGQTEDAISLFRDLGDWDAMVQLIMKQAPSMLAQGRYRPLEEWLDSLPKEMLENDPWLLYWKGASRFPFGPSIAQSYFEKAFEQFRVQDNLPGILLAWSGVVDSILYTMEDFSLLDRWIQIFPDLPENPGKIIPLEIWIHIVSSMFTALAYRRLEHSETEVWIRRAESIVQGPAVPVAKAQILLQLVHCYLDIGDYEQSLLGVRSLQQLAQPKEALPLVIIMTRLAEAMYYNLTGDDEKCLKAVSEGVRTTERTGISFLSYVLLGLGIANCQNFGDLGMAQSLLGKMASSWDRLSPYDKATYHFVQARQFLLRSQLDAASAQVELALKTTLDVGSHDTICLAHLLAAQVMHSAGKRREAWSHLHEAFLIAERLRSRLFEYNGLMIEACFHFEQGDESSGLISLRKGLAIGKEQGFLNTFVDQPAVTARLCIKALAENIEVPYVRYIIRKRKLIPEKPPLDLENWPWPLKIYALGKFEILKDEKPIQFSGKIQKKPLLFLKAMIALGAKDVKEEKLSDLLWPEADGDQAYSAFRTTLSRLRQLIGNEKAIDYHDGKATLNPLYCWVDAWAFERICEQVDSEFRRIEETVDERYEEDEKIMPLFEKAINLYKGHFLTDEREEFWTTSYRERLRSKYLRLIIRTGDYLERAGRWEKAAEHYLKGLEIDELAEEFYQHLMICYKELGQHAKAIETYRRCKKTLSAAFGIEPSPKTEIIYNNLKENIKS
jgi:ATP/maltotriose-dependent transcriptional regulator MalT/DNA-binding SARP family transcriptional activator